MAAALSSSSSSSTSIPRLLLSLILLCSLYSPAVAKPSPRPITDQDIRQKKNACYADIERTSVVEKENCALRCLSPTCYSLVYESDPLEEGERDYNRAQEYQYCMHKLSLGDSVDGAFDY